MSHLEMTLTREEQEFLASQGLAPEDVYDGRRQSSINARKASAKEAGKLIVVRDPGRSQCGHRLTTRAGHCIQCDTSKLAYAARYEEPALVYIAASPKLGLLKLGITQDIEQRVTNLNGQAYAGTKDWKMLFFAAFQRAGAVESRAQSRLTRDVSGRSTFKDGRDQGAAEIFRCSFDEALEAIARAAQELNLKPQGQAWKSHLAGSY